MNLADLQREAHAIAKDHGWWDEERTFGDCIALVHSELSEALEAYRAPAWQGDLGWRWLPILDDETAEIIGNKPVGVPSELADVVIRVADMAEWYGYDLGHDEAILDLDALETCFMDVQSSGSFGDWIARLHWLVAEATGYRGVADDSLVADALASLVLGIEWMAAHYGIDLDAAIEAKMEYNRTRSYRHGGRAL